MTHPSPTEMLEEEHRVIQKVVGAMAAVAEALEDDGDVEADTLREITAFMRTFADQCHHGKEETHLFPVLERKGVPARGCPLGALIHEHQNGRALVAALAQAEAAYTSGDRSAKDRLASSLRGLIALYPGHIWKEDYLLFPMSNKVLSAEDQQNLSMEFEKVEETVGRDVHRRLEQLSEQLGE